MRHAHSSARYQAYHQASQTMAKTRQVVMLYDGAIRFIAQAKEAALAADHERRYFKLSRVCDILSGLQSALDFESGEEMGAKLYHYYQTMTVQVLQLHYTNKAEDFSRVSASLKTMRDVWDAIDRGQSPQTVNLAATAQKVTAGLAAPRVHSA